MASKSTSPSFPAKHPRSLPVLNNKDEHIHTDALVLLFLCRYLSRLARGPDVIWDRKNNPTPWNNVEPGTNTKMMSVNQQFDKQYKRDRL